MQKPDGNLATKQTLVTLCWRKRRKMSQISVLVQMLKLLKMTEIKKPKWPSGPLTWSCTHKPAVSLYRLKPVPIAIATPLASQIPGALWNETNLSSTVAETFSSSSDCNKWAVVELNPWKGLLPGNQWLFSGELLLTWSGDNWGVLLIQPSNFNQQCIIIMTLIMNPWAIQAQASASVDFNNTIDDEKKKNFLPK